MDPLSLTANIIAVASAASSVSSEIRKLAKLRDAPKQILQLQNELSDCRIVLSVVQDILTQTGSQSLEQTLPSYTQRLLQEALGLLQQISTIIDSGLVKYAGNQDHVKISWKIWVKNRGKLERLCISLRNVRQQISQALTLLTASEVPRIRAVLQTVSVYMDNMRPAEILGSSDTNSTGLQSSATQERTAPSVARKSALDNLLRQSPRSSSTLRFQTEMQQQCRPLCMCRCHTESRFSLPEWMSSVVGSLFVGYSSIPVIGSYPQKCTENSCLRTAVAKLRVDYYFPSWFLGRMIALRERRSPLDGHQISVRTPRVCDSTNFIFTLCRQGDLLAVRDLFSRGEASPFDVDLDGNTPLTMALNIPTYNSVETCRLLLQGYADPEHENKHHESSVDILWNLLLSNPFDPVHIALKEVFAPFMDSTENLQRRRFTVLHYIVLNLSSLSLSDQLELSTSEIESKCSLGRTPLLWAVSICNISAVKTLLDFGADITAKDNKGFTVLHRATSLKSSSGNFELLTLLLERLSSSCTRLKNFMPIYGETCKDLDDKQSSIKAFIDLQNSEGHTALLHAVAFGFAEQVHLLLAHNAATEMPSSGKLVPRSQPILMSIQLNRHSILRLFLERGVKLDVQDWRGDGLLHYAGEHGDIETIRILKDLGVCCIDPTAVNYSGQTALDMYDDRVSARLEDEVRFHESREAFIQLLQSVRPLGADHNCWKNGWNTSAGSHESADSEDLGNEEFFDALSIG